VRADKLVALFLAIFRYVMLLRAGKKRRITFFEFIDSEAGRGQMTLAINDTAPDFEAQTTEGKTGRVVFTPQGFHTSLYYGAGLYGENKA